MVYCEEGMNSGPSAARNRALSRATSSHITLMDSDDQVAENYVENIFIGLSSYDAFAVRPVYRQGNREIRGLELDSLTSSQFANFYGSVPFVAPRSWIPTFPNVVAEDGVATINVIHRSGGTLPVVNATYFIQLSETSYCASQGSTFTERYQPHLDESESIALQMGNPGLAADVATLYRTRLAMSKNYDRQCEVNPAFGYHEYVMASQHISAQVKAPKDANHFSYGL
ncbi:glycosyltransferase (plasmid) [Pseudomonas sp. FeN3W]|nr:glycosyltransferase [Pseudomonas sp. FeN3W]